ncbi:MAG: dTDP-4-dehydrorhamnose 3,5-epimerase [Thermoflexales bacterium]|nr:dTDP-4-dehydrorhamnose 3,5-epimerase [Thermoflexales bacterium]
MKTRLIETPLSDLVVVEIDYFNDERGFFMESWHKRDFAAAGLDLEFVQEGHSGSSANVLRGLHYQDMTAPMGKLVRCIVGRVFDVAVDLRASSPTLGQWFGLELSAENKKQFYVPVGFAHGFAVLSDYAEIQYKQTGFYTPSAEGSVAWNDPDIGVAWPITDPILSRRDQQAMSLKKYLENPAFR